MISASEIKALTTISSAATGDDSIITDLIFEAISYVANQSSLSEATSGESFEEMAQIIDSEFCIWIRANDVELTEVTGYDADKTAYEIPLEYVIQINKGIYEINYQSTIIKRVKVKYNTVFGLKQIQKIIKDIVLFEYLRIPKKTGAMNKTGESAGQVVVNYRKSEEFYSEINSRLGNLMLGGL